jgi:glycine betaine catabolism B
MQKASKYELIFTKKEKISKDTYTFYFDRKKSNFDFIPGQYIKIFLDIENADDRGSSRYFTISSSPTDKDYLTITTRIIKSSFKLKLNSLNPGDKVRAFGPIGYFTYDSSNDPAVFVAGGIGVTPFHSLIRYFIANNKHPKITLFNSFSYKDEAVFYDEFKSIEKENPNIKIVYSLTKERQMGFETGRINKDMIKKYVPDFLESSYFIVGPEEMVSEMFDQITKMGVSEEKIFNEDFTGY